jgi:N-acyl-D-amino-acid deacylase
MTLLIKNVRIIGAARDFPDICDVFVNGEKISAIGNFADKKAAVVIDGQGAYLSPGFIDVNTDSDHYLTLFDHPEQADFLRQGVTTIFGGMCGSSLAPLLYGTLESVRKWGGSDDQINVDWHTMAEFLATLDRRPLAVNFGTLVGHNTIRRAITGNAVRELTKNELAVFSETLRRALDEGGFGLSTNLGSVHTQKASHPEIKALTQIVKNANGMYATHLRKTGEDIDEAVDENIKLVKETGASALINHFVPILGAEKSYERALAMIEALPSTVDLRFDLYPFDDLLLPFYTFLPDWVRMGGFEIMLANIQEEWLLPKIKKEMAPIAGDRFIVAQAPGNDFLVGKSLLDLQDMYDLQDGREALLKLMVATKMRGVALYKNINSALMKKALIAKRSFVSSNAASFGDTSRGPSAALRITRQLKSDRTTSTFTQFLELVEREHIMPLIDAIKKITLEPAQKFGLTGRGEIKEGNFADLTGFRNGEIKFTIVNGKVAMRDGEFAGNFAGKALRRAGKN